MFAPLAPNADKPEPKRILCHELHESFNPFVVIRDSTEKTRFFRRDVGRRPTLSSKINKFWEPTIKKPGFWARFPHQAKVKHLFSVEPRMCTKIKKKFVIIRENSDDFTNRGEES